MYSRIYKLIVSFNKELPTPNAHNCSKAKRPYWKLGEPVYSTTHSAYNLHTRLCQFVQHKPLMICHWNRLPCICPRMPTPISVACPLEREPSIMLREPIWLLITGTKWYAPAIKYCNYSLVICGSEPSTIAHHMFINYVACCTTDCDQR